MYRLPALRSICAVMAVTLACGQHVRAATDGGLCELTIRGHSIERLILVEKTDLSGIRFDEPGETVRLPAGEYRVTQAELEGGYVFGEVPRQADDWFTVSPEGPNELVVGAPLYPTATARRRGGFLLLNYDGVVDGANRKYLRSNRTGGLPPPPTFKVYSDGEEIGSGSFEYG